MVNLVAALLLAACSSGDAEAPSPSTLSQAGASGDEGGEAGAKGEDAAPDCSSVKDEKGEMITVRVVNDSVTTLYLGEEAETCAPSLGWRFELRDADGQRLAPVGNCGTCRDAVVTGSGGCPSICLTQPVLTLEPGEHADLEWDGLFNTNVALPEACALPGRGLASAECRKATRLQPGAYTFTVRAGVKLDCGDGCQDCRERDGGGCETPSALVETLDREASADVELESGAAYGSSDPIELVFRD